MAARKGDEPKRFRVSARTILQLGGELISSDGIAFYELIKNSVDAGSKKANVDIRMQVPLETIQKLRAIAEKGDALAPNELKRLKNEVASAILVDASDREELGAAVAAADTLDELLATVVEANTITFRDTGSGMTLEDLEEIYLTVGTPHRLNERKEGSQRVILGEKGIGRLSAMRLGNRLHVKTSTAAESRWNELEIDWNEFGRDASQLLDEIELAPSRGEKKTDGSAHGTTIRISDLNATWSAKKLGDIAASELCRFTDPFASGNRFPIHLRLNGTAIPVPRMDEILSEHAHAKVEASLSLNQANPSCAIEV